MHAWALSARSNYAIIILQGPDCTVSKVGGPALGVVVSETLNASIIDTRADQKPAVTPKLGVLVAEIVTGLCVLLPSVLSRPYHIATPCSQTGCFARAWVAHFLTRHQTTTQASRPRIHSKTPTDNTKPRNKRRLTCVCSVGAVVSDFDDFHELSLDFTPGPLGSVGFMF